MNLRLRFWLLHAVLPLALFVLGWWFTRGGGLDHWVASRFYSAAVRGFPLREAYWAQRVLHDGGHDLILTVAAAALILGLCSLRITRLVPLRGAAFYLLLCIGLASGLAALGKSRSNAACPWDLQKYGGSHLPATSIWGAPAAGNWAGHCFPGAHSSGAFALFGLYFLARRYRRRWAAVTLGGVAVVGVAFAATQWARGAHFPSHDLTSAAIAWTVCLLLDRFFAARRWWPQRLYAPPPPQPVALAIKNSV